MRNRKPAGHRRGSWGFAIWVASPGGGGVGSLSWRGGGLDRNREEVYVLEGPGDCREVRPGIEVVGAPWTSKRPLTDLVAAAASGLQPAPGVLRVMVGH